MKLRGRSLRHTIWGQSSMGTDGSLSTRRANTPLETSQTTPWTIDSPAALPNVAGDTV